MSRQLFDLDKWMFNTTEDAEAWVEKQLPAEEYGRDILIFENWDLRALLEQAYMAGKESTTTTKHQLKETAG